LLLTEEGRVARWYISKPKNPYLGNFWRVLQWKMFVPILYGHFLFYGHLAYFPPFRYIFPRFGILHPEISGNPGGEMLFVNESTNEREREKVFFLEKIAAN
jgi:hypothetical protein